MTPWELRYLKLGADVLVELASERSTGSLFWELNIVRWDLWPREFVY